MEIVFEREKHIYQTDAFEELIKDTIRFFNDTPVHKLSVPKSQGTGVYAPSVFYPFSTH